jgi:glycosyltransferase involved in cell wall biosynthesis
MKKISVLMPSYNDADSIIETLDSLIVQKYENWELIIIDDGSSDNTEKVVSEYKRKKDKDNKIKYIYQENQDQLLAIINGLNYITGDYIYILHSDDLLYDCEVFNKAVDYLEKHKDADAIIGDLTIIDENSKVTGVQKVLPYLNKKRIPAIQLLWLGRNLYVDFAFHRKDAFMKTVYTNYLVWDKPFWFDSFDEVKMLLLLTFH